MNGSAVLLAEGSRGGDQVGILAAGGLFLLLIVIVWQVAATWRARMLAAREDGYRQLVTRYRELLEDNVEIQRRMAEEITHLQKGVTSMERMMREIE